MNTTLSKSEKTKKKLPEHQSTKHIGAEMDQGLSLLNMQMALTAPEFAQPETILHLQGTAGNHAVQGLLQRKAVVGAAQDHFEQEAERVAAQAMSMPEGAPKVQRMGEEEEEEIQTKPLAKMITPLVQREPKKEAETPENEDEQVDEQLTELEEEVEDMPERVPISFDSDIDDLDENDPKDLELLKDELQNLIILLDANKAEIQGYIDTIKIYESIINGISEKDIEEMAEIEEKSDEIGAAVAAPISPVGEDVTASDLEELGPVESESKDQELADLEAQLENEPVSRPSDSLLEMREKALDDVIKAGDQLDAAKGDDERIRERIRDIQERLGILKKSERRGKLSFGISSGLKSIGRKGLAAAPYLLPVAEPVFSGIKQALATVSLAKTLKHIIKLKELRKKSGPELSGMIQYAIGQKEKKALGKGAAAISLGVIPTAVSAGRAIYKKFTRTKGVERERIARQLHARAQADPKASAVVRELVGSRNMDEALGDDGWKIIFQKLSSSQ